MIIQKIMEIANHPLVVVCWNSNPGEPVNGSIKPVFDLLKNKEFKVVKLKEKGALL